MTTKKAPSRPQITPTITAQRIESIAGDSTATPPNFSSAGATLSDGFPCKHCLNMAQNSTAVEQEKNDFQSTENFQKSFGFDSSYAKRAPPIGAPKAALTPAAIPAATNSLLLTSFL